MKRKSKGCIKLPSLVSIYSGVPKYKRATAEVGILINDKYKTNIEYTLYINERIYGGTIQSEKDKWHTINVYCPDRER